MSKKKPKKGKADTGTPEIPEITKGGPGVARLMIPDIDVAVSRYEKMKQKRCEASPGEVAAKKELRMVLLANRDQLHQDDTGARFYRKNGKDYVIVETIKLRDADDGESREEL